MVGLHKPSSLFYQMMLAFIVLSAFLIRIDTAHANAANAAQQHMGQVLFAFYQGDHYGALLQQELLDEALLKEEQQQQMALLKGGLSLSYGLTKQAQEVFEELLNEKSGNSTQAMAWFWLGKIHYQQNDYRGAQAAFEHLSHKKVRKKLDDGQQQEMRYMQAQIAMHLAPGSVEKQLNALDQQSIYRAYINFNRGVELLEGNQREQGIAWLQQAYQTPQKAINKGWLSRWFAPEQAQQLAEHQALNDRIQLALGYGFMQADQPKLAVSAFTKVHEDSLDTNAALLGYGWALAQQKDYEKALSVWQQLIQQPGSGLYAYEAMLASAYAFEQADANTQALDMLNNAQSQYEKRLKNITTIKQNVAQPGYFQPLIEGLATRYQRHQRQRFSAVESIDTLPVWIDNAMAIQLWSQPATHTLIQQLIDIETQLEQLERWKKDIDHFHLLVNEREAEATRRNEQVQTQDFEQQLADLSEQVRRLSQRINQAEKEKRPELLADEGSLSHQKRLNKALAKHDNISTQKLLKPSYAERLSRLQGLIDWQLSEAFPDNLWQSKKRLVELGKLLADAKYNQQRLLKAMDRRADFNIKRGNIEKIDVRIEQQTAQTQSLKQRLLAKLTNKNMIFLANEQSQLRQYLYQAKLSKLRLQDKAYAEKARLEAASTQQKVPSNSQSVAKANVNDE